MSRAAYSSSTLGICVGSPFRVKDIKTRRKHPRLSARLVKSYYTSEAPLAYSLIMNWPSIEARKEQWRIFIDIKTVRECTLHFLMQRSSRDDKHCRTLILESSRKCSVSINGINNSK